MNGRGAGRRYDGRMNTPTDSPEGSIDCSVQGPLLLIAINRPAKRNGFTPKMFR